MRIGFIVQGSTDSAFIEGLKGRWCKHATLESLGYRGSKLRPRDYSKACKEAWHKGCDVVVILTDSDNEHLNPVYKAEKSHLDAEVEHYVVLGVAVRNIECWICANPEYIAQGYPCDPDDLRVDDPKSAFQTALGITKYEKKEEEIALLVCNYPSLKPMLQKPSFKRFYDEATDFAQRNDCQIPNEMDN